MIAARCWLGMGMGMAVAGAPVISACATNESSSHAAVSGAGASAQPDVACDHDCLLTVLDTYIDALTQGDPRKLALARDVRATENTVATALGEGLWRTKFQIGSYRQDFADATLGQVGCLAVIESDGAPAFLTLRLKVVDRHITESELLVTRDGDSGFFAPQNLAETDPVFDEIVPESQRLPRAALQDIVARYFDGIVKNDAQGLDFDPDCRRLENGVVTAMSPNIGTQFANFSYIKAIDKRFAVIDEERGLVWGIFSFQIPGDDTRAPRTTFIGELFKIVGGPIRAIQAFLLNQPYGTSGGWE
jgi:hypothetical protein